MWSTFSAFWVNKIASIQWTELVYNCEQRTKFWEKKNMTTMEARKFVSSKEIEEQPKLSVGKGVATIMWHNSEFISFNFQPTGTKELPSNAATDKRTNLWIQYQEEEMLMRKRVYVLSEDTWVHRCPLAQATSWSPGWVTPKTVQKGFWWTKWHWDRISPLSITPQLLHIHSYIIWGKETRSYRDVV